MESNNVVPIPDLPADVTENVEDKRDEGDDSENPNTGVTDLPKKASIGAVLSGIIGATVVWRCRKRKRGEEE